MFPCDTCGFRLIEAGDGATTCDFCLREQANKEG